MAVPNTRAWLSRRLTIALAALALLGGGGAPAARAQQGNTVIRQFSGVPSGTCANIQIAVNLLNGDLYDCLAGGWHLVSGAGGAGTFDLIGSGVNTSATMTLGSGSTLTFSGSGINNASKIQGVAISGTPATGQIPISTSATTAAWADPIVSGPDANAAAPSGNPVVTAGWDGTNVRRYKTDTAGVLAVNVTAGLGNCTATTVNAHQYCGNNTASNGVAPAFVVPVLSDIAASSSSNAYTFSGNNLHSGTETFAQLSGCQYVNASQTFAQAIAVVGVTCITVDPGTYTVAVNATIPTTVGMSVSKGGLLSIANGVTLTVNAPIYASPDSQIFTYVGTGVAVLGGANSVVSNAWFPGADWCAQTLAALTSLQSGSNRGGTVDGRHYVTAQTCAANPFAGITMPFQLLVPNANIALNDERAQWLHVSNSQQVYGANPALNPGQIYPTSWPEGTLTNVVVTSNVAAVTISSALPRAPIALSVWCIAGTTDPAVEGCIQVLASPAPTTTTFSYNAPGVTNRTATGGTVSAAMIAFSSNTVQSSFYKNMYVSGNGLANFVFANITGQEQTGFYDSTITQYCTTGIFAGGLNTNLAAGPGNNSYTNDILGTSTACAHSYTKDIWINREQLDRKALLDTSITGAGGSAASGDGVFVYNSGLNFRSLHIENRTAGIRLVGGAGFSLLSGSQLSCTAGLPCTSAIVSDSVGARIAVTDVNTNGTNLIVNSFTGSTITGTGLVYYYANSASPKFESYEVDGTNKVPTMTLQAFAETVAPPASTGNDVCYGDSTAHALKCSYNNGSFFNVPLVGIANTWSANQSFNSGTLLPSAAGGTDLGSTALPFGNLWLGTAATNNFKFQPATTSGARIITIADPLSPTTVGLPLTIGSGTAAMTTAAVAGGACGTTVTVAATGVLTTDVINVSHNAAVTAANGGLLALNWWPTAGNVNFNYCNGGTVSNTPTAMTINWRVIR